MTSRLTDVIIDCHDLDVMADFWCAVLGYERGHSGAGWLGIRPPGSDPTDAELRMAPLPSPIAFVLVPVDKEVKNRVHLDVAPYDCTRWVVMADPEGNEFCVMPGLGS